MEDKESGIHFSESEKLLRLPEIKSMRLGEYGKALEQVWSNFEKVRYDGFYAGVENQERPRYSNKFAFHGHAGRSKVTFLDKQSGDMFPRREIEFIPPQLDTIGSICNIGVISSDIEFKESENVYQNYEEETYGTADFWIPDRKYSSASEHLLDLYKLQRAYSAEFIVTLDSDHEASATLMFAFDTSRAGLKPLMEKAMYDTQPKNELWASQYGEYVKFPTQSGRHLAVPIGLPANYIEYIVVNEMSKYWVGKLDELKSACMVDGYAIPLISLHTGEIL